MGKEKSINKLNEGALRAVSAKELHKLQAGDEREWSSLVKRLERPLEHVAGNIVGRDNAQDMVQEGLIYIAKNIGRLDPEEATTPYIFKTVKDRSLSRVRVQTAELSRTDLRGFEKLETVRAKESVEHEVVAKQSYESLINTLTERGLPQIYLQALVLKEVEGYAYHEISQLLDIPLGTVQSRIKRAKDKAKKILEKSK